MSQMVVLGTWHDVQGAQKRVGRRLDDTEYKKVLERLLAGRDFVFEEATGLGPTTAEHLALDRIGAGHYLDVDPGLAERWAYRISEQTGAPVRINPDDLESECCNSERVDDQSRREYVWLQRIRDKTFESGLLVCGFLHVLGMSLRLVEAGYAVEAHHYTPCSSAEGVLNCWTAEKTYRDGSLADSSCGYREPRRRGGDCVRPLELAR